MKNMTAREFYNAVAANNINDDVKAYAVASIEAMDAKNAARKDKPSKAQMENAPLKDKAFEILYAEGGKTAGEMGEAMGVTSSKASAVLKGLVADGRAKVSDTKVKGRTVKFYEAV